MPDQDRELPIVDGPGERKLLTRAVVDLFDGSRPLQILEAGCGKRWPIELGDTPAHLTGIDTDLEALKVRREKRGDLDEEIVADLREYEFPTDKFDLIYCSYVLEHVAGAEGVMDSFVRALRGGGRLIIRIPDGDSVYGWVTRQTPFRFHVWYKRVIKRNPRAGRAGYGPYPTVYDDVISRRGLRHFAETRHLTVIEEYGTNHHLGIFGRGAPIVDVVLHAVAFLSLGRLSATHNNVAVVLEKRSH